MSSLFDAINAAAMALSADAEVKSEKSSPSVKPRVQPKSLTPDPSPRRGEKVQPKAANGADETSKSRNHDTTSKRAAASQTTKQPNDQTTKTKGGAKYVIPAEFKQAIETYLNGRADMKAKLSAKGKTIDGCCDYIFDVMRRRAEKERKGQSAVGLYADPAEIFGLAVHYYDESEESLKAEANS